MQKYIGGLLVLFAMGLAACSGGGSSNNAPLNLTGVVVTTPPPVTPTPAPTPTPANTLKDGGFEAEGAAGAFNTTSGWTPCSMTHADPGGGTTAAVTPVTAIGAVLVNPSSPPFTVNGTGTNVTPAINSGTFAALTYDGSTAQTVFPGPAGAKTGTKGANGICQTVTVPANASLTMFVNEGGTDGAMFGDQEADIINGTTVTNLFMDNILGNTEKYTTKGPFALNGAPYNIPAGTSVQLFIGTYDNGPGSTFDLYMFVDDVILTSTSGTASVHHATPSMERTSTK